MVPTKGEHSFAELSGPAPIIAPEQEEYFPGISIAEIKGWGEGQAPQPAKGLNIARFAENLDHPRQMLLMPNGDVLVAETNSQPRENKGIEGVVMRYLMGKAGAGAPSADRIKLLRDSDGDGVADVEKILLDGLFSPYGMVFHDNILYVANTNALMAFPYELGQEKITDKGKKLADLPATNPNNHWSRNLILSADKSTIYIAVGSATNIAEKGLAIDEGRAAIYEYVLETGKMRVFGGGLRNPIGMAIQPVTQRLWTVVNERDMLGPDLVPDYLTQVNFGDNFGWPWIYWGDYEDARVQPRRPDLLQYTARPDYALGAHTAPIGLVFTLGQAKLGKAYENGAIVSLHGSWNRSPKSGYKLVYIPFNARGFPDIKRDKDGKVIGGLPVDIVTGFLDDDGNAFGRPADMAIDSTGAILISDDASGIIWRLTSAQAMTEFASADADNNKKTPAQ